MYLPGKEHPLTVAELHRNVSNCRSANYASPPKEQIRVASSLGISSFQPADLYYVKVNQRKKSYKPSFIGRAVQVSSSIRLEQKPISRWMSTLSWKKIYRLSPIKHSQVQVPLKNTIRMNLDIQVHFIWSSPNIRVVVPHASVPVTIKIECGVRGC